MTHGRTGSEGDAARIIAEIIVEEGEGKAISSSGGAGRQRFGLKRHAGARRRSVNFPCPHCSYQGWCVSGLQRHILTHTGEKPFQCSACSFKTAGQNNLKVHMQRRHRNSIAKAADAGPS